MKWSFYWLLSGAAIFFCMMSQMVFAANKVVIVPLQGNYYILPTEGNVSPPPTVESAGQIWLDRNLGASQVATSFFFDEAAYGDLYQWGRGTDGHEKRSSGTTSALSSSDTPGHGDFITALHSPQDWRSPQNSNLWQGVSGVNNPCPAGFRLPTETEWKTELRSWGSNNSVGAYSSPLKLVAAGYRGLFDGQTIINQGSRGGYWSSTASGSISYVLYFDISTAYLASNKRRNGYSVRCLMD